MNIAHHDIFVTRKIDDVGRLVLPKEILTSLDIRYRDAVDIHLLENGMLITKHNPSCIFCGAIEHLQDYKGRPVCQECWEGMVNG